MSKQSYPPPPPIGERQLKAPKPFNGIHGC